MMGVQEQSQSNLFHYGLNLDKRIRSNHPLRRVSELIDFDFAYAEVKSFYGHNGNESVPPPVILKLMLLLVFYNVRSERELIRMQQLSIGASQNSHIRYTVQLTEV